MQAEVLRYPGGGHLMMGRRSFVQHLQQMFTCQVSTQPMLQKKVSHPRFSPSHRPPCAMPCRQWSLSRVCYRYMLPIVRVSEVWHKHNITCFALFDDMDDTIKAIAAAPQLVIVLGIGRHAQRCGAPVAQCNRAPWSKCQLCLVAKPGHIDIVQGQACYK